MGYEKSLNSTALRFGNRKLLYEIIHNRSNYLNKKTVSKNNIESIELKNDINELEKNIYSNLIQDHLINETEYKNPIDNDNLNQKKPI